MNAPRVTQEQVEAAIVGETYTVLPDGRTTICQLTLYNDFTAIGKSACVSKENFDPVIGNKIARENALNEVWQLLGFRLAEQTYRPALTHADVMADIAGIARPDFEDPLPEALRNQASLPDASPAPPTTPYPGDKAYPWGMPQVSDAVQFFERAGSVEAGPLVAFVTKVHDAHRVDLLIFAPNLTIHRRTGVHLLSYSEQPPAEATFFARRKA